MRALVAGSSGMIGSALVAELRTEGHDVVPLVRRQPGAGERSWDPEAAVLDPAVFDGIDAVVFVGGVGVGDKRWSEARKQAIYDSRVGSTRLLADTMATLQVKPAVFLCQSAIGWYGDRGDEVLTEDSAAADAADDFLASVVIDWEGAAAPAAAAGIRTVHSRTGIVLDSSGGALGRMLLPYKLGIGGRIGSGRQWWSFVTLQDTVGAMAFILSSDLSGPVNVVAPHPVTNADFVDALGDVLHRPTLIPVPRIALDVILGHELAGAMAFTSARVLPQRLGDAGHTFAHPTVTEALRAALA